MCPAVRGGSRSTGTRAVTHHGVGRSSGTGPCTHGGAARVSCRPPVAATAGVSGAAAPAAGGSGARGVGSPSVPHGASARAHHGVRLGRSMSVDAGTDDHDRHLNSPHVGDVVLGQNYLLSRDSRIPSGACGPHLMAVDDKALHSGGTKIQAPRTGEGATAGCWSSTPPSHGGSNSLTVIQSFDELSKIIH